MKALSLEIRPLKGFGELEFGMTPEEVIALLGNPDDQETLEDDDDETILIYHYDELDISLFFEGEGEKNFLVNVETGNHEAVLFGKKIFTMKEDAIIIMMKELKYSEMDSEILEDEEYQNEKRVSFDDAMTDFFFEEGILTACSWGNFFFDEVIEE